MPIRTLVLLTPSATAAVELPRRVAATGHALAGIVARTPLDLARAIAEPALLGRGLRPWGHGHTVYLAETALADATELAIPEQQPRTPFALALGRSMMALRAAGISAARLESAARTLAATAEDGRRLRALAALYAQLQAAIDGRFADASAVLDLACETLPETGWLAGAEVLIADDLSLDPAEARFVEALARKVPTRRIERAAPLGLSEGSFHAWCDARGIEAVPVRATLLAPLFSEPAQPPPSLLRIHAGLFDPPGGAAPGDGALELVAAAGEAAEVRAIVRRLLREAARGVAFEEMAVILPRADVYAPLFVDVLRRVGIPHRLHPSLPLSFGRTARALMLLLACRGLSRTAVTDFLTFAPIPFEPLLGEGARRPNASAWDAISREAGIVGGLERWIIGLRSFAENERQVATRRSDGPGRSRHERRAAEADALLRVVEILSATLDGLWGEAAWGEWSSRLRATVEQWIGESDVRRDSEERATLLGVIQELAALASFSPVAPWSQVERVLAGRLELERAPLEPVEGGAVHVGAMDTMAGVPFRVVAIPGLVEGGYPGPLRPDPFLLDSERKGVREGAPDTRRSPRQLSFFDAPETAAPVAPAVRLVGLPTTHDRLLEARRAFHAAIGQARERVILSYPRADARSGRERLPSLFLVAAASTAAGRTLDASELDRLIVEDSLDTLELDQAVDRVERDRSRLQRDNEGATLAIAAGARFFKQARCASRARWSRRLTAYDGNVGELPDDLRQRLDPVATGRPVSASRLAAYARCGFQYLLRYVLHLEPLVEPEERLRLDPLERGSLFHDVAERFLRERRDRGELPLVDTPETRARLRAIGDEALDALVAASPPRYTALWEHERERFHASLGTWLTREVAGAERATPAYFEVTFGRHVPETGEPHLEEPLAVDLGEGRQLRIEGRIDRIDTRPDGSLVLRDYKTGRAPRDDGAVFRPGVQLQIPIYLLAAARILPDRPVARAFLDYVDGGRQIAIDPQAGAGEGLALLLKNLVAGLGEGLFPQEPSACDYCDFTEVCGPQPLLQKRHEIKRHDPRLARHLRFREGA